MVRGAEFVRLKKIMIFCVFYTIMLSSKREHYFSGFEHFWDLHFQLFQTSVAPGMAREVPGPRKGLPGIPKRPPPKLPRSQKTTPNGHPETPNSAILQKNEGMKKDQRSVERRNETTNERRSAGTKERTKEGAPNTARHSRRHPRTRQKGSAHGGGAP